MSAYLPSNRATPLAGREEQLRAIWGQIEQANAGKPRAILLAGDPGIGKTRCLHELAARAAAAGMAVLRGGALEAEGMPPYLPFLEALGRQIAQADLSQLQAQVGGLLPILAPLFPELEARLGPQPAGYRLPAEQARLRLYDAIGRFLAAIAGPAPLLLLLDDLQWADRGTFELLAQLVRQLSDPSAAGRVVFLGTYRAGEVADRPAFERMVVELNRLRCLSMHTIGALGESAIGQLAASLLGAEIEPAMQALLYQHSEGNPFFAEELLHGWLGSQLLVQQGGRWALHHSATAALPASLALAIQARLARLEPALLDLLQAAAIIGRTFDLQLLAELADRELEAAEDDLHAAAQAHIVQLAGDASARFSHDKIREVLYDAIPASRRRRMHSRVGQLLERAAGPADAQRLAGLAFHFGRAGDQLRGADYALRAAKMALDLPAADSALAHYRMALELSGPADPRRGEILLGMSAAALASGMERDAIEMLLQAQAWFADRGDREQAALAMLRRGHAAWRLEDLPAARAAFEEALALLAGQPGPAQAQALIDLGSLLVLSLHQQREGLPICRRALDLAWACEDTLLVAAASRALGNALVRAGDLPGGIALLEQGLALAEQAGELVEATECCMLLTHACYWSGDLQRTFALADTIVTFARRTHDPYQLRHIYTLQAQGAILRGDWDAAQRWLAAAQREVEMLASPEPRAFVHFIRGNLAYERGDYSAAIGQYESAIAVFRTLGPGALVWYLGQYGLAQLAAGERQSAQATAAELAALVGDLPAGAIPTATVQCMQALIALELGDGELVAALVPALARFSGHFLDLLVDRVLGQIAISQRDWQAAHVALDSAEAAARKHGLRPELARTLRAQAALAQAQGGAGAAALAARRLDEARALYASLGNQRMLGELARQAMPRRPAGFPADLSAREVEVLRLVAIGKSNREIAQALIISEKTVANHLANILAKTDSGNRAAAAAFAIRNGLA